VLYSMGMECCTVTSKRVLCSNGMKCCVVSSWRALIHTIRLGIGGVDFTRKGAVHQLDPLQFRLPIPQEVSIAHLDCNHDVSRID